VDGAWWPHSDDLTDELPALIAALSDHLGAISCVMYNDTEWTITTDEPLGGGCAVRLDGYPGQPPNTVEVFDSQGNTIALLVVPFCIHPDDAHSIVMAAASPGNASSVDTLLMITGKDRDSRTQRDAARKRWDSQYFAEQEEVGIDPRPWGRSSRRVAPMALVRPRSMTSGGNHYEY
jgi:hypothetical protein